MVEFEDERPIYLAGKDAGYHVLRISIRRFTKVLEGFESRTLRRGYDC